MEKVSIYIYKFEDKYDDTMIRMLMYYKLIKLVSQKYHIPVRELIIKKLTEGNPIFEYHREIKFSCSHTRFGMAFSVGKVKNGIDIERIKELKRSVIEKVYNENEKKYVGNNKFRYYEVWTRKEAYLKYIGTGIVSLRGLRDVSTLTNCQIKFETVMYKEYVISLCIGKEVKIDWNIINKDNSKKISKR